MTNSAIISLPQLHLNLQHAPADDDDYEGIIGSNLPGG